MNTERWLHRQVCKDCVPLGYTQEQSSLIADDAVKRWKKGVRAVEAHQQAIKAGKSICQIPKRGKRK